MSDDPRREQGHRCELEIEEQRFWSRRGFLGAGGAVAGALAVAACKKAAKDVSPAAPGPTEPPAAAPGPAAPAAAPGPAAPPAAAPGPAAPAASPLARGAVAHATTKPVPEQTEPTASRAFPLKMPGKIVQITHPNAMLNMRTPNKPVVERMVNQALMELTGARSPAEAMSRFFRKEDIIALHPNCLGSPYMGANPVVTYTLVKALLEMGVPEQNLIIYDQYGGRMQRVGYRFNKKGPLKVLAHFHWGYEQKPSLYIPRGRVKRGVQFCNILKHVTAVINIPVPKDHDLAGITGALKNMAFGNIKRVPQFHWGINENIANIYNHPLIRDKVRLHVTDALRCLYQGGPQDRGPHKKIYNSILASTDPVTTDLTILDIVNEFRVAARMPKIEDVRWPRRRPPQAIEIAAKLGLGVADRAKIQHVKKVLEG